MSLRALSGLPNLAPRADFHPVMPRQRVEIHNRAAIPEHNASQKRSEDFADVVTRQLPGMAGVGAVAAPAFVKRAATKARPFGKRANDDDYVGPVELDQDEFVTAPTRVRRQVQSPNANPTTNWVNGDLGYMFARYANGTQIAVAIGSTVYAVRGSEDSCGYDTNNPGVCYPLPQLQARIQTQDGSSSVPAGTLFALKDDLSAYSSNTYINLGTSENTGVPYWMQPDVASYIWSIDQSTGVLSATYSGSVVKFAANQNRVPYQNSQYNGNGDVDAWPQAQTISADHAAITLYLSKTPAT